MFARTINTEEQAAAGLSGPAAESTAGAADGEPAAVPESRSHLPGHAGTQAFAKRGDADRLLAGGLVSGGDAGGLLAGGLLPGAEADGLLTGGGEAGGLTSGDEADRLPGALQADGLITGRVARGRPAGNSVVPSPAAAADGGAADTVLSRPVFLADLSRLVIAWARGRALGLSSACGISVALAVCAATWFSGGTRTDNCYAVAALWASYLVVMAGQKLAKPRSQLATSQLARQRPVGPVGWLAALGGCLAESFVYAGLALGAAAEHWTVMWPLAIAVLGLVAVRNLMTASSTPPGVSDVPEGALRRVSSAILTMPVGGRVLLIGIVAPVWGARAALLALLDWGIVSVGYGIAGRAAAGLTARERGPGRVGPVGAPSKVLRLRDDGALARSLGALVRGNLVPLPPAVLGLAAVAALALLGLHGLPGVLTLAPAIVMLLAAPGSGNPHTGRFDWLVPVLLLGSQFLYLAATGFGAGVPDPVIFALGAALLLRYCDLAFPGRPVMLAKPRLAGAEPAERGTALGWEGRMLLAGLAAATGIATFAYLAMTAYLGVLICAKVVTSCLAPEEETVRDRPGNGGRREPPAAS
jgi:hypothetical protein